MRARVAYIHSFGTTTILVAAALLILAVGGAIVAFNGWPGSASDTHVGSVAVAREPSARPVAARARPVAHRPAAMAPAASKQRPAARAASTAGLVKTTVPAVGPGSVVPGVVMVQGPVTQAAPPTVPAAQQAEGGGDDGDNPKVDPGPALPEPIGGLPDAGSLLPPIALPPPPPVTPPGSGIAGPDGDAPIVTMVDDALGAPTLTTTLPPLPELPGLPPLP